MTNLKFHDGLLVGFREGICERGSRVQPLYEERCCRTHPIETAKSKAAFGNNQQELFNLSFLQTLFGPLGGDQVPNGAQEPVWCWHCSGICCRFLSFFPLLGEYFWEPFSGDNFLSWWFAAVSPTMRHEGKLRVSVRAYHTAPSYLQGGYLQGRGLLIEYDHSEWMHPVNIRAAEVVHLLLFSFGWNRFCLFSPSIFGFPLLYASLLVHYVWNCILKEL